MEPQGGSTRTRQRLGFLDRPADRHRGLRRRSLHSGGEVAPDGRMGRRQLGGYVGTGAALRRLRRGVFPRGSPPNPVYLVIDRGREELRDASAIWGKDSYETDDAVKAELGDPAVVEGLLHRSVRGGLLPAGRHRQREGTHCRRSGVGAVDGLEPAQGRGGTGKKTGRMPVADRETLRGRAEAILQELRESKFHRGLTQAGTGRDTEFPALHRRLPQQELEHVRH